MNKKLINCKDCNNEVSKKAKKCPHCGVNNPAIKASDSVKGLLLLIIIIVVMTSIFGSGENSNTVKEKEIPLTAEEVRKEKIEKHFSPWDGSHKGLERLVKENLNDPESYDHIKTTYWDKKDKLRVRMEYRARNGFGGMVVGFVLADVDLEGNVIEVVDQG